MQYRKYNFPLYIIRCPKGDFLTLDPRALDGGRCSVCGAVHVGIKAGHAVINWYPSGNITITGGGTAAIEQVDGAAGADQLEFTV